MTIVSALTMLALASPIYAAGEQKEKKEWQNGAAQSMSAEEMQGMQVVSQEGEKIGEISKAHAGQQSGNVQFVTISKSDADRENIAVPLEALQFDRESGHAKLKVAESKLDNAPQQADKSTQVFLFELEEHYGVAPGWQEEAEVIGPPVPPTEVPGEQIQSQ